ncbi:MAG: hypothetical protein AAGF99_02695 [Bacteroidota bacterium]
MSLVLEIDDYTSGDLAMPIISPYPRLGDGSLFLGEFSRTVTWADLAVAPADGDPFGNIAEAQADALLGAGNYAGLFSDPAGGQLSFSPGGGVRMRANNGLRVSLGTAFNAYCAANPWLLVFWFRVSEIADDTSIRYLLDPWGGTFLHLRTTADPGGIDNLLTAQVRGANVSTGSASVAVNALTQFALDSTGKAYINGAQVGSSAPGSTAIAEALAFRSDNDWDGTNPLTLYRVHLLNPTASGVTALQEVQADYAYAQGRPWWTTA